MKGVLPGREAGDALRYQVQHMFVCVSGCFLASSGVAPQDFCLIPVPAFAGAVFVFLGGFYYVYIFKVLAPDAPQYIIE